MKDFPTLSRRTFLMTSAGAVAVTILGAPKVRGGAPIQSSGYAPQPGVANQRIDGVTKVTGQKIYARDYHSRDIDGWPDHQWYALYLRALTTTREFRDVDLSPLHHDERPRKVILGSDFATGKLTPRLNPDRDRIIDEQILDAVAAAESEAIATGKQIDHPDAVTFDLVVQPGNRPDFLGQAVALLLFDSLSSYRKAKRKMQFDDAKYQVYGPEIGPNPDEPTIFQPETLYVKAPDSNNPAGYFSYYTATPTSSYDADAQDHIKGIETYIETTDDLITHKFTSDMRAMDPMFMEPESGLVWYDAKAAPGPTMNLLLGTQSPDGDVKDICQMYFSDCDGNDPLKHIVLHSCFPGGGFGGRDSSPFSLMLALTADFADGNPVKLEYDRFEQFRVGLKRHACDLTGSLTVRASDRTMQVVQMNMSFDGGGRRNLSPYVASLAALCAGGSYVMDRANIYAKAIHSENVSGGSQRGFGGPQAFFAIETAIDEVASEQHWDPIEFRLDNVVAEKGTTVVGGPILQSLRLTEMLEIARDHPLWADREAIREGHAQKDEVYGTGIAMSLQAYGTSGDGMVAAIKLQPDGSFTVESDAVDMGNGSATTLGVVIGPILGANANTVGMGGYKLFSQTGLTKNSSLGCDASASWQDATLTKKSVGSSSACLTGLHQVHVVQQCARALKANTIVPVASELWGGLGLLDPEEVICADGHVFYQDFEPLPLQEIANYVYDVGFFFGAVAHAYFQESWVNADFPTESGYQNFKLDGLAYFLPNSEDTVKAWRENTNAPSCESKREARYVWAPCVNVIGLTVDRRTGRVQVENVLSVLNAGSIHVPQLVSGQSQGGVAMALGYSLLEDMPPGMAGPANGEWNLNRYHVPRYGDVPLATSYAPGGRAQELILLPPLTDQEPGRGIAEAVMCSIAPAISNALKDATGARFTSLPITPEKILEGWSS